MEEEVSRERECEHFQGCEGHQVGYDESVFELPRGYEEGVLESLKAYDEGECIVCKPGCGDWGQEPPVDACSRPPL